LSACTRMVSDALGQPLLPVTSHSGGGAHRAGLTTPAGRRAALRAALAEARMPTLGALVATILALPYALIKTAVFIVLAVLMLVGCSNRDCADGAKEFDRSKTPTEDDLGFFLVQGLVVFPVEAIVLIAFGRLVSSATCEDVVVPLVNGLAKRTSAGAASANGARGPWLPWPELVSRGVLVVAAVWTAEWIATNGFMVSNNPHKPWFTSPAPNATFGLLLPPMTLAFLVAIVTCLLTLAVVGDALKGTLQSAIDRSFEPTTAASPPPSSQELPENLAEERSSGPVSEAANALVRVIGELHRLETNVFEPLSSATTPALVFGIGLSAVGFVLVLALMYSLLARGEDWSFLVPFSLLSIFACMALLFLLLRVNDLCHVPLQRRCAAAVAQENARLERAGLAAVAAEAAARHNALIEFITLKLRLPAWRVLHFAVDRALFTRVGLTGATALAPVLLHSAYAMLLPAH